MQSSTPFTIERVFSATVDILWKAISDKNEMKNWYFDVSDFNPVPGFEFTFTGGTEERQYVHLCKVVEVVTNKKLSYTWKYEGYPGESKVTFELFPEGEKTRLRLTHDGLETFPSHIPDFAKESFAAGWNDIIGNILREYVDKKAAT